MLFGRLFETFFLNQGSENREMTFSLDLGWDLLSVLPKTDLNQVKDSDLEQFYDATRAKKRFGLEKEDLVNRIIKRGAQ